MYTYLLKRLSQLRHSGLMSYLNQRTIFHVFARSLKVSQHVMAINRTLHELIKKQFFVPLRKKKDKYKIAKSLADFIFAKPELLQLFLTSTCVLKITCKKCASYQHIFFIQIQRQKKCVKYLMVFFLLTLHTRTKNKINY